MKKLLLIVTITCSVLLSNAQSVSINTDGSTAAPSAILDVKSTTKGMLIPRMTTAQRTAIASPANGLMVYDTDLLKFYYYNGTSWTTFSSGSEKIGFRATGVNPNFTIAPGGLFKLHFSAEDYDFGNGFTPSTSASPAATDGTYKVPVSGVYHLDAKLSTQLPAQEGFSATINVKLTRAGLTTTIAQYNTQTTPAASLTQSFITLWPAISIDYSLLAGDFVWIELYTYTLSGTDATITASQCHFNGHLVFAN